jgi:nucleotide-binding universal stress UspA family protein
MAVPPQRRIVVGVDGLASSIRALEWAVRQAEVTDAAVEVITTWEWPVSYGLTVALPDGWDPRADAQKLVDDAVARVRGAHPDVTIRTSVIEGHPAPVLVDASRGADLLVVGSRGHGEFAGMLLGSVSEHCVTNAYCPVLVMREDSGK